MSTPSKQPGFWRTVRILLGAARRRSTGRQRRQQQLLHNKSGENATNWGGLGSALSVLLMLAVNVMAAVSVEKAVKTAQRDDAQRSGKIAVSEGFLSQIRGARVRRFWTEQRGNKQILHYRQHDTDSGTPAGSLTVLAPTATQVRDAASGEAITIAEEYGGSRPAIQQKLIAAYQRDGPSAFVSEHDAAPGLSSRTLFTPIAAFTGSLFLLLWIAMLVFQGEGLELDLQRRRHPMWEWMLSHPAPPGAIFFSEMLSPIAANPIYWSAPVFTGFLYGFVYGLPLGALAAVIIGVPITVAAACLGKALEIGVVLRLAPRTRGAIIGLMSWAGYATMMLFLFGFIILPKLLTAIARPLSVAAHLPSPWLGLFLGGWHPGAAQGFSFTQGLVTCWIAVVLTLAASVWFSVWATNQGLSGNFAAADSGPARRAGGKSHFSTYPLYRKEMLWFLRDRSAVVQTILIPVTVAGLQMVNLRRILVHAGSNWNYLSGAAIFFGTYFLWILGPKSLASEGNALWMALTWPTGLESLLKAKAWLWSIISSVMVGLVLCYAVFLFPGEWWKIALVAVAWFFFGRSMAEKAVTLVTVTSDSGEVQKIPSGRRWAAQLGMMTFAIGVLTQQWHIAAMGIVYSTLTAAAMWQNFRARLPYLYDQWSETLPPPPTLMHAMVAISILVEVGAMITGLVFAFSGGANIAIAQAISYGICSVAVSLGTANFLSNRGVNMRQIWIWTRNRGADGRDDSPWWQQIGFGEAGFLRALGIGIAGGAALGLFAHGYDIVLQHLPYTAEMLRKSREAISHIPDFKLSYGIMAVVFAPFAEEYLFRGLLFRALDREWGGWRAILGSAAFFAFYHQPLAWLPVFMLGTANALLFKKSRTLLPAVLLHMTYNAIVITWT